MFEVNKKIGNKMGKHFREHKSETFRNKQYALFINGLICAPIESNLPLSYAVECKGKN